MINDPLGIVAYVRCDRHVGSPYSHDCRDCEAEQADRLNEMRNSWVKPAREDRA